MTIAPKQFWSRLLIKCISSILSTLKLDPVCSAQRYILGMSSLYKAARFLLADRLVYHRQ